MMNRLTLSAALAATSLLFFVAGCVVQIRPDGGIRIDLPPFAQPNPPAAAAPITTTVPMTATAIITNTPILTGTVTPTASLTTTATATLIPTAPTAATGTVTATTTVTATATVTATLPTTSTPSLTPTDPITATGTPPTGTPTGAPTTGTPATGTPPTSAPPTSTTTRPPATMTPSPGTITATPTRSATLSPTVTRSATPTSTRTVTGTPTGVPTATAATPPPTPTRIPGTVFLGSHQGYAADSTFYVVGEVINGEAFPVFNVKVIGSFYDTNGNLVGAQESVTDLVQIEPELSSPFRLQVDNSGGNISSYELTLTWDDVSIIDYEELTILSQETRNEGQLVVFGELRNEGSVTVSDMVVVATFYDSSGAVVDVYRGTVATSTLAPDETASYTIPIPRGDLEYDHITVQAQGSLQLF